MKTVRLMTCDVAEKAHLVQGALANEGIESVLHNENFSSLYRGLVGNIAGVDVFVMEEDYDRAVQTLKRNGCWPEDLKACPYCGTTDISLKLRKGGRWKAFWAAVCSALTMTPPGNNHWEYVCGKCGKTFDIPVPKASLTEDEKRDL